MEAVIPSPTAYQEEISQFANRPATTPMHRAVQETQFGDYCRLAKDTLNTPDQYGRLPLHLAAHSCNRSIKNRLWKLHGLMFCDVKEKTENLEAQDNNGYTPLHYAVAQKRWNNIADLMEANANPNIPCHAGNTPLHWAVLQMDCEIVCKLLLGGASPIICNNNGDSPLDLVKRSLKYSAAGGTNLKKLLQIRKAFAIVWNRKNRRRNTKR